MKRLLVKACRGCVVKQNSRRTWRPFAAALALMVFCAMPARAEGAGGVSGFVVDPQSSARVAGVNLLLIRDGGGQPISLTSNQRGFFSALALEPGAYILVADGIGGPGTTSCVAVNVDEGEVVRVVVPVVHYSRDCAFPKPSLIDASQTADIYRI